VSYKNIIPGLHPGEGGVLPSTGTGNNMSKTAEERMEEHIREEDRAILNEIRKKYKKKLSVRIKNVFKSLLKIGDI
jgi:hypothetical protein